MLILITALILKLSLVLGFNADSKSNVAVYWGQASAGSQESLASYCQSSDVDIVLLSFLYAFPGNLGLDFSSACSSSFGDGLLHCDQIGQDIKTCQSQGKKVMLSMGGAIGSYGFSSDSEAEDFATTLWNTFAGGSTSERPFNDAVIDGFDFDIENQNPTGYAALAKKLRNYFNSDSSKKYYLSAAPQCFYPDASVGDLMNNAELDFAFIQFYNNYCNVGTHFNWDTWTEFAAGAPNPNIKLYLGLPGSSSAAGSGYLSDMSLVQSTVNSIGESANFGGIMLWDASQSFTNKVDGKTYAAQMKSILNSISSESTTLQSSTVASSTASSLVSSSTIASSTLSASSSTSFAGLSAVTSSFVASASTTSDVSSTPATTSSISQSFASSSAFDVSAISFTSLTTSLSMSSTLPSSHAHAQPSSSSAPAVIYSTSTSSAVSSLLVSTSSSSSKTSASAFSVVLESSTSVSTSAAASSSKAPTTTTPVSTSATTSSSGSETLTPTSSSGPGVSTTILAPTNVPTFVPTTTSTSAPTATSWAHTRAIELNAQYAAGQLNGKSSCSDGEIVCSGDGQITICDHGSWVYTECAVGTTCFAYDFDDTVYTSCNFAYMRSSFV
ncbi:LAME_0G10154g1_1 [Lachancea meyersii CBS 8951]|uniref:chitinase n=1 Tax=Lachancea meyersii CBS 8951 TaxID=1266667 RepID=A0A1G4K8V7_9SACH|nr:LAME_0G10154g1_1 [Lachancea meyersii CBS 8951]